MLSHRPAIVAFVSKLVGDNALAEDIAQETFLRATKEAAKFRGDAKAQSWLSAIALNLVRDHFRKISRSPKTSADPSLLESIPDCAESSEQSVLNREMSSCIARYAGQLPRPQYDVVILHDMAGLKHREIAAELGLSEANSRVLLHRGQEALRQILQNNCALSFGQDDIPCEPAEK
jgi:RNA polymerase sigma-70 factor (ECF subfamily)